MTTLHHHPFPPTHPGTWVRRRSRFVVLVKLEDGTVVPVHTNNTGSMKSCNAPGSTVRVSHSDNPNRKLPWSLHAVRVGRAWVGVDTSVPAKVFAEALRRGDIPTLKGYRLLSSEVAVPDAKGRCGNLDSQSKAAEPRRSTAHHAASAVSAGPRSRLDALLESPDGIPAYVELKNTSLREGDTAMFPDAVSERATRHVKELAHLVRQGFRAFVVFMVQRSDVARFRPADHIDPAFAKALRRAVKQGVVPIALRCVVSPAGVRVERELEVEAGIGRG